MLLPESLLAGCRCITMVTHANLSSTSICKTWQQAFAYSRCIHKVWATHGCQDRGPREHGQRTTFTSHTPKQTLADAESMKQASLSHLAVGPGGIGWDWVSCCSGRGRVCWIGFRLDGRMERMGMEELWLVELNNQSMRSLIAAHSLYYTLLSSLLSIIDAGSGRRKNKIYFEAKIYYLNAKNCTWHVSCFLFLKKMWAQ